MTTPKPSPGRHGWVQRPVSVGWWWRWKPDEQAIDPRPVQVLSTDDPFIPRISPPGTLWFPCLPPEPPVL